VPNRSHIYDRKERTSSFVSQTVLLGMSVAWSACCASGLNIGFQILASFTAYVFLSFLKVNTGSIFPSDALATFPVGVVNIGLYTLMRAFVFIKPDHGITTLPITKSNLAEVFGLSGNVIIKL
jgi:hypothetical protein